MRYLDDIRTRKPIFEPIFETIFKLKKLKKRMKIFQRVQNVLKILREFSTNISKVV